jgi:hypothetical protein
VHVNAGKKKVYTRNGLDWTKRFSLVAGAIDISGQAIIDGEVVVVDEGRTNFSELQAELAAGRQGRLVYYAFDLLWRDGDLRKLPQLERKRMLADLLGENDIDMPVIYSEHLTGDGQEMFEHAAKLNWEGIISKQADAPYRSERTEAWLKIKTVIKGKFPIIGFVKDPTGVAALYLGKREGKDWSTWARWERDGPEPSPAKSANSSIRWSAPRRNSPSQSRSPRQHGLSRRSLRTLNSETSPPRDCCAKARLRDFQRANSLSGTRQSKVSKCLILKEENPKRRLIRNAPRG